MSRRILCQSCGDNWKPHPTDIHMGFDYRKVFLAVKKPTSHCVAVITEDNRRVESLDNVLCDSCGRVIPDGEVALEVSMWRLEIGRFPDWEHEYGTVLTPEAAKMERTLTKEGP